ncbi:uncharacterized protein DNG_06275 [Cephalotrichum gorgonifer]|uniref:Phosphatidic acid phosphatase type 2/haloperoxidase domain-containing protein n=1 Tax=Cephalotrichum gorgonifer TaxID=2041049 RepID=A0AAE8MZP1_9PEZI|nr:uncharacterized protein DNG_06275 [Cephalotrichum gorgonifer]
MKISVLFTALSVPVAYAAYPGDIVQYWVDQSTIFTNGSVIGGLASPPSSWYGAAVHGAIYSAALKSEGKSLAFQQLAVSHAAHNSLLWVFQGTRLYNPVNAALRTLLPQIGIDQGSKDYEKAASIGRKAAAEVAQRRVGDGLADFVDYTFGPADVGVYQATPNGNPLPDTPQAVYVRPFGGIKDISKFRAPPPPDAAGEDYEKWVVEVKEDGSLNSTTRSEYDTDTAYFWRESSVAGWNRFANNIVGDALAEDVVASAKFYAQLNYALANAAIGSFETKYAYDHWRPITAIRRPGVWLASGNDISDPDWTPLLRPTPSHPDYVSTHSAFGGAAAEVLRAYVGGDTIDASLSSNVTLDARGVITRHYTSLTEASEENARSRVLGGVHFTYAGSAGIELGEAIAKETLRLFNKNWDKF